MRRRIGIPPGGDILDIINAWPEAERQRAHQHIQDVEREALEKMQLYPGIEDLCRYLDERQVPRAIVTRNVASTLEFFHQFHWRRDPFSPAISREFTPYKPNPAALLHICEKASRQSFERRPLALPGSDPAPRSPAVGGGPEGRGHGRGLGSGRHCGGEPRGVLHRPF